MDSDLNTKQLIKELKNRGVGNYTNFYDEIKRQLFDEGIYIGNWDCVFEPEVEGLKSIRIIQEDEYDNNEQDSDGEDFPSSDKVWDFIGGYIFIEE